MARRYFGTDGVRGKVGDAPITPDFVLRLGYAAGKVLAQADRWAKAGSRPTVLIGKDTRVSGYMLEAALEKLYGADLTARGEISSSRDWKNAVQIVARENGVFTAGADPRKGGTAAVGQ